MKKTLLVMAMVIALAMSTMAGATAKNAPGEGNGNGAIQGVSSDPDIAELGEIRYLFNRAGYHFWFTATGDVGDFEQGDSYHSIYKYSVDDPENWCFLAGRTDEGRAPYNIGGTIQEDKYYKIWNETDSESVCGTFEIVSGDVLWSPTAGPNTGTEITSTFTAYIDEEGVGTGEIVTTNTMTQVSTATTIDCVLYEDDEVWMSGDNAASQPVVAYARAGSDPAFNQWTNPNVSPQDCTAKWSGASQFLSGTIDMY